MRTGPTTTRQAWCSFHLSRGDAAYSFGAIDRTDVRQYAVPGFVFFAQNNLSFVALQHMSSSAFQVRLAPRRPEAAPTLRAPPRGSCSAWSVLTTRTAWLLLCLASAETAHRSELALQLLLNMRILAVALLTVLVLDKRLNKIEWASITLLMVRCRAAATWRVGRREGRSAQPQSKS